MTDTSYREKEQQESRPSDDHSDSGEPVIVKPKSSKEQIKSSTKRTTYNDKWVLILFIANLVAYTSLSGYTIYCMAANWQESTDLTGQFQGTRGITRKRDGNGDDGPFSL